MKPYSRMTKRYTTWSIVLIISTLLIISGCSASTEPTETTETTEPVSNTTVLSDASAEVELTLEELKAYNGSNGMPIYLAHEGIIYDVSNVPQWASGSHNGIKAGTDITGVIEKAPHGVKNLQLGSPVGKIVD